MYVVVCCFMHVTTLHWVVLSESSFTKAFFSLMCNKEVTYLIFLFLCSDFTTIRRGFMKSQEDSTGKPEDGEQIIRYWSIISLSARFEWWIAPGTSSVCMLFRAFSYPRTPSSLNGDGLHTFTRFKWLTDFHIPSGLNDWYPSDPNDCLHTQIKFELSDDSPLLT